MLHWFKKKPVPEPRPGADRWRLIPQLETAATLETLLREVPEGLSPLVEPFSAGGLFVSYVFFQNEGVLPVLPADLEALGLTARQAPALALENLRREAEKLRLVPHDHMREVYIDTPFFLRGELNAACLLLPELWQREARASELDLLAVVPHRRALFCCFRSPAGIYRLRQKVAEEPEAPDRLTDRLLRWHEGGWRDEAAP